MSSCYLCKHSKSKEYTVRGFFDKTKLNGQFQEIPEEVDVHISCSLLLKANSLLQVNGNWEIRGLEESLRFNNSECSCCKKVFDYRNRPFIVYCHHNECFDQKCKVKEQQCQKRHCSFTIDLGCVYNYQVYDIIENNDPKGYKLQFLCIKHSTRRLQNSHMNQIQEQIIQKFFTNYQQPQYQQTAYHISQSQQQQQQQVATQQSGQFLQGQQQAYDSNAFNHNQGQQHYHQQQQNNNMQYANANQGTNLPSYNQPIVQEQQPQQTVQYPPNQQVPPQQQYPVYNASQQKSKLPPQQNPSAINNSSLSPPPQIQTEFITQSQHEQIPPNSIQKKNYDYSNTQQQQQPQKFDAQGRPLPQSPHFKYQGGSVRPNIANNTVYDYNSPNNGEAMYQSANTPIPPGGDGFQQQLGKNQKGAVASAAVNQIAGGANQFTKNIQPPQPQPWSQVPQQQQQQHPSNQANNQSFFQRGAPGGANQAQYQQNQYESYGQSGNSFQGYANDDKNAQNQNSYNPPYQNQPNNQDYNNNNAQNAYQPYHPSQPAPPQNYNGGYNSKYQSAAFPDLSSKKNDTYPSQPSFDRQDSFNQTDRNQFKAQQKPGMRRDQSQAQQATVPAHDNTYSFTSNIPQTGAHQNKVASQDHPQNTNDIQNVRIPPPAQPIQIQNSDRRKILNPNVDTNPNGISLDITDQIQIKRLQLKHKAQPQAQQQTPQQPPLESQADPSLFQRNNSVVQQNQIAGVPQAQTDYPQQINAHSQQNVPQGGPIGQIMKNPQQSQQHHQHHQQQQQQYFQNQSYPTNNQYPPPPQLTSGTNSTQPVSQQHPQGYNSQNYQTNYQQQGNQQGFPSQNMQHQTQIQQQQQQQQQPFQQPQQQIQSNSNSIVNQPSNVQSGMKNNIPYQQQGQEKQRIQGNQIAQPPSKTYSQQTQSSTSQQAMQSQQTSSNNDQINNAANFGVPLYRRQSQQQMVSQPPQQVAPFNQSNQPQQPQFNPNLQPVVNAGMYNSGQNQQENKQSNMQIEESQPSTSNHTIDPAVTQNLPATTTTTKKRGAATGKRGKKNTEDAAKPADVPVKQAKPVKAKVEKKTKKKQSNVEAMEEENCEGLPSASLQLGDQSIKEEQSAYQQPLLQNQDGIDVVGPVLHNPLPPQIGSENNITNKIESQDSMDFQSQTSLGNQVQRQNFQIQKEQKYNKLLQQQKMQQEFLQMQQQHPSAQKPVQYQQPQQQQINPQNMPHLVKQPMSGVQPPQILERQASLNQNPEMQIPGNPSDLINQLPQQLPPNQKAQSFQKQGYISAQPQKKKSGPLINNNYKPYFVDIVDVAKTKIDQKQQIQQQQQFIMKQYQQGMLILQNQQPIPNGNYKQQFQPSPFKNSGQMMPPHLQGQQPGANIPYNFNLNPNQQMHQNYNMGQMQGQGINQGNNYVQNGQQQQQQQIPAPPGHNSHQQIQQQQQIQPQKLPKQNLQFANPHPVQQFAQANSAHPSNNSKEFKNEMGSYHHLNSIQNQGNKENNS